jgi:TgpA N-terminal domain/Transglutaminase-like superfamily
VVRGKEARVALAAFLATAAAAWVAGGVFQGWMARPVALAGAAAGVGGVWLAMRRTKPTWQYGVVPGAFILGYLAALILPNDTGVTGTVPELVRKAIENGGLSQPPVPFDPGWRFVIVALLCLVGAAATSLAIGLSRPKLSLLVPLPIVIAGALSQPAGSEVLAGVAALVLLAAGLMMTFSAELADDAEVGPRFEMRQLVRGAGGVAASLVVVAVMSQAGALFPEPEVDDTAKPQKPQTQPLNKVRDRPLFEVQSSDGADASGPWRIGVLDTYDKGGWLLPPLDLKRFEDDIEAGGAGARGTVRALVTIRDIDGFNLPALAAPTSIGNAGGDVGFDPRTQVLRVRKGSPGEGYRYTIEAARPPTGEELAAAFGATPVDVVPFAEAPAPPLIVVDLLATAPNNPWERLQYMRSKLYGSVIAAGAGVPVDINAARVGELLRGGAGSPYEIVAAEALLARWAGIPARIGYGFKGGSPLPSGAVEFRPKDGANWLEVWFPSIGWTPIVGTPPKAQPSLNNEAKNVEEAIRPAEELSLQIYLPVQNENPLFLFQVVRYWLVTALPFVLLAVLLIAAAPWLLKQWRRQRRVRWALAGGPGARIAVAYAEFRDLALDFNVGSPMATPLEFLDAVADDDEHAELAWLVTRGLYGDLSRDLQPSDADAAEVMSASLQRRLARAQTGAAQLTAAISKTSLRAPYDAALPNAWWSLRLPRLRLPSFRRAAPATAMVLALALFTASCGGAAEAKPVGSLPDNVLPGSLGTLTVAQETGATDAFGRAGASSMVAKGSFWTLRSPATEQVQAALQVSVLDPAFSTDDIKVRRGIRSFIETGNYRWFKVEGQWVGVQELTQLRLYLWFPNGREDVFEILQVRPEFPGPKALLTEVIRHQQNETWR